VDGFECRKRSHLASGQLTERKPVPHQGAGGRHAPDTATGDQDGQV
jgi:hypothetical protein